MLDPAPHRNNQNGPAGLVWQPFQVRAGGTVFSRTEGWEPKANVPPAVSAAVLRSRERGRDMAVLTMLGQHRYLTTRQLEALFFSYPEGAQRQMSRLQRWGLVTRWHRLEPRPPDKRRGWRRHHDVFLLTARGALVSARFLRSDVQAAIRRAFAGYHYGFQVDHALGAAEFFTSLIADSRERSEEGLYYWVGDDELRRVLREQEPTPDGGGRYLTAEREIDFYLEWDVGTEAPQRLREKAEAVPSSGHILWVGPTPQREQSIRSAIASAATAGGRSHWTTHAGLLRERGPLGELWQRAGDDERRGLQDLDGRPRGQLPVEDSLGKPRWWERRPGGGEGA